MVRSHGRAGEGGKAPRRMKKPLAAPLFLILPAVVLYVIFFIWPAAIGLF